MIYSPSLATAVGCGGAVLALLWRNGTWSLGSSLGDPASSQEGYPRPRRWFRELPRLVQGASGAAIAHGLQHWTSYIDMPCTSQGF